MCPTQNSMIVYNRCEKYCAGQEGPVQPTHSPRVQYMAVIHVSSYHKRIVLYCWFSIIVLWHRQDPQKAPSIMLVSAATSTNKWLKIFLGLKKCLFSPQRKNPWSMIQGQVEDDVNKMHNSDCWNREAPLYGNTHGYWMWGTFSGTFYSSLLKVQTHTCLKKTLGDTEITTAFILPTFWQDYQWAFQWASQLLTWQNAEFFPCPSQNSQQSS